MSSGKDTLKTLREENARLRERVTALECQISVFEAKAEDNALLGMSPDAVKAARALRQIDVFIRRDDILAALGQVVLARDVARRILGDEEWKAISGR